MTAFRKYAVCAAALGGLAAAAFTVDQAGVRAESAMDFLRNQHQRAQPHYPREPVRVRRGLFGGLFDTLRREFEAPPPRVAAPARSHAMQRIVCRRTCDGAQLVLGIVPAHRSHAQEEAMCTAAGGGEQTRLIVEKFVPGAGFEPAPQVQTASAATLMEGRAALDDASAAPKASACGEGARFMTVPIRDDATLRKGDIVATRDGFKVFVGKGKPPFDESDFADIDKKKRIASSIEKLRIADR